MLNSQEELELKELEELDALEKEFSAQPAKTSSLEAAARGAKQSASLGFSDEGSGLVDALLSKTGTLLTGGAPNPYADKSFSEVYKSGRDEERQADVKARKDSPGSFLAGSVAGGLATPSLGAGIAPIAGLGALAGLGGSEASNIVGMAKDTAIGTGIGALGGLAGAGLNKLSSGASKALDAGADEMTILATGATGKQAMQFPPGTARRIREEGLLSFGSKAKDLAGKLEGTDDPVMQLVHAAASKRAAQQAQEPLVSMKDLLSMGAGTVVAGPAGLAAPIARKVVERRAPSALAVSMDKASKMLEGGGKFSAVLKKASEATPRGLAITHFMLGSSNPEYQEELDKTE